MSSISQLGKSEASAADRPSFSHLAALTHLRVHHLLPGGVLAPEPPLHEDTPELHVEDDGVASEEADLLLQHGSLLTPGHLVALKSLQLQTASLALQTLVFLLWEG